MRQQIEAAMANGDNATEPAAAAAGELSPPFLEIKEITMKTLGEEINAAIAEGLTPLIIDRSEQHLVDMWADVAGYFISGKQMSVDKSKNNVPVPDLLENARMQLQKSMKEGRTFTIMCVRLQSRGPHWCMLESCCP